MEDHAEQITREYGSKERLISRRVERRCFGCEEDELCNGADREKNY